MKGAVDAVAALRGVELSAGPEREHRHASRWRAARRSPSLDNDEVLGVITSRTP